MGKVISMGKKTDNVIEFLNNTKKIVKENNIDNLLILAKDNDGNIMIGNTSTVNISSLLEFAAHIQLHATDLMIQNNYL